ncbi:hypothetical protein CBF34_03425 [Vagococcus penaei]|uniref:Uncharacterized protein n=1 Tax=Vagococcus penaei TaxID=633807 RepID=A0A1Q2D7N5_9ENTE|nr:hypothetical protein [Vagococcus penaei]AQP54293.1 hypothetical protein BW732_08710 [Vagococcus penaei]RSU05821.1 hypothetical protein CBF34_03425 [Vagococcus penaei]
MKTINYTGKNVTISFLPYGDIKEILAEPILINQYIGTEIDGSINNLYLRVYQDDSFKTYPLLGKNSTSTCEFYESKVCWSGQIDDIFYQVTFRLSEHDNWFFTIDLMGTDKQVDVIYGQDLGLAAKSIVLTNEAYNSQYIDHSVYQTETGYTVCSRQNMEQEAGCFPMVQQGSLTKTIGFVTDGYQFFGREYREDGRLQIEKESNLPNVVYQYEMAYIGLQSTKLSLSEDSQSVIFYGSYITNHPEAVTDPIKTERELMQDFEHVMLSSAGTTQTLSRPGSTHIELLSGRELTDSEIETLFPKRKLEEIKAGKLLSFFDAQDYHIVLKAKEILMERSHGHIILSGEEETIDRPVLASTVYMNGLFNAQIVYGNTTMNKFISNSRNPLNCLKKSGQRLYIKRHNEWQLLGMPSAFKMGFNFATWYYQLSDDLISVTSYTTPNSRMLKFTVTSHNKVHYDWVTTFDVVMNDIEHTDSVKMMKNGPLISFEPTEQAASYNKYPGLRYDIKLKTPFYLVSMEDFFGVTDTDNLIGLGFTETDTVELTINGTLSAEPFEEDHVSLSEASQSYDTYIANLSNHFHLEHINQAKVDKVNSLVKWYTHNMLVHYLSPHGLEQYGGAAWGTRDVCQGPVEYFFAMEKPEVVRSILLTLYAHQFEDDGNWPQWFMFDRYEEIKAAESHGDIIVWPLKVISDYLHMTKDYSVLEELLPYANRQTGKQSAEKESLLEHIEKQISYLTSHFLPGTYLSSYGDGDWDDTLQPADQTLKKNMASSWTVALTYQTLRNFSQIMVDYAQDISQRMNEIAQGIKHDFHQYMIQDGVISGFILDNGNQTYEAIVHPNDQRTGINYRLLPMTRSMIAELISPEEVVKHYDLIQTHLTFPDATRLMDQPAHYAGGVSRNFKRAEQAANLGREVGLAYIHAHIRYVEAMAKIGKTEETWSNLEKINPIGLTELIEHASLRQANAYFSSSDGAFNTRYDAQNQFNQLKTGEIEVKGGWRIYSSGPGIYLHQLISQVLGIREDYESMIFDPVLPSELDGLLLTYQLGKRKLNIRYHLTNTVHKLLINGKLVETKHNSNQYRQAGLVVSKEQFNQWTKEGENEIEIFIGEM